jgi:tetratricopeptide (TPR) repeat protein
MIWKMKSNRLLLIITVLIWLAPNIAFCDVQSTALFQKANNEYAKGLYKEALASYQSLINDGYQSASLYFNMGNASYKLADYPSAILYYEKAHKLAPADEDINFNIKFANLKTTDKIDELPEFFLARWWRNFILGFSISALSTSSILLVLLASAMLILYFFSGSVAVKKISFYASLVFFGIGLFTLLMAAGQRSYFNDHKQAIIFSGAVSVKNSPLEKSGTLLILHDGTKVSILESSDSWLKIRLANGNEGWIKASDVKEI